MANGNTVEARAARAKLMWQNPAGRAAFLGGKAVQRAQREATLIGQRFNSITVTGAAKRDAKGCVVLEFVCDCGQSGQARACDIRTGNTKSCGCARKNNGRKRAAPFSEFSAPVAQSALA
jgi:hypothetical protein